ncbi:histidine kinase dimerization/phosphoacceptor domain -containing protein [Methanobacterium sp.]|uniref:histidine kinase dimerization/phosphoacceptor domain -containing protein n=1 Tax=Methanobacterium sp. TaxID=2164 RepID=UPI003C70780C
MNLFALISFVAFIVCFFLGNFIYHKNPKSQLNIVIGLTAIVVGFLAFTEFEYRQAETFQTAFFWIKVSALWPIVPSLLLHISLIFTKSRYLKNKLTYILIYLPSIIIITLSLTTNLLLNNILKVYWGWTYAFPQDMTLYNIMSIWTVFTVVLAGLICFIYYLQSKDLKKKQAKYIFAGLYIPLLISLCSDAILPSISLRIPEMTMTTMTIGICIISYGIWKYRFPALTPAIAADSIVSTMSNFFFLLDENMHIITINQATKDLLGFVDSELVGKSLHMVFAEDLKSLFKGNPFNAGKKSITNIETTFKAKNGQLIPVFLSLSQIEYDSSQILGIVCIGNDITDIKLAENKIKASLKEKNLLLQEIHHRVKNNLQIISSLLSLQSRYVKDKEDLELFKESQSRVKSMAFIHEQLYQSSDFTNIEFELYVQNLLNYLFHSYFIDLSYINFKINIANVSLDINTAIPCGLIINELVTNSLKYAFPMMEYGKPQNNAVVISDKVSNEICISLHHYTENKFILIVSDNGIGLPENIDFTTTSTLGLQLVNSLVNQLDGTIELDRTNGTKFKVIFNKLKY